MSLRRDLASRSRTEWAVRVALAVLTAVLGWYGVTFSIAQVVAKDDPATAHRLAPYDGRITAALSAMLSGPDATPAERARSEALAKLALRQDPTAVVAVATLGVNADLRGETERARQLFTFAQKLSRRDLRTNLWMIEDAVRRGDIPAALHQYDITLRVFPSTGDTLYPVLAAASGDPAIRSALVRTLAGGPAWGEGFINYVAGNSPDPRSTAVLFLALGRAGVAVPEGARAGTVNALIAAGQLDAAWSYYATVRPGADRRRSRDPGFAADPENPSQFDWVPAGDGGPTTGIQGGIFDFAAPASVGGPLLQQLQLLPPGNYRLTGHSIAIEQAESARPYWLLRCRDGRELGRAEVPNSAVAGGAFSGTFSVPAGCPVQTLVLMARPSDAVGGLSGQLDRVALAPVAE